MKRVLSILLLAALLFTLSSTAFAAEGLDNFNRSAVYTEGMFSDVPPDAWYAADVKNAYELGLVKGAGEGLFNPDGNMTIAEVITLASRIHSVYFTGSASFTQGTPWYQVYLDYAVSVGIIQNGQFADVKAPATRAQFAVIMANALPEAALPPINAITYIPDVKTNEQYRYAVLKLYNAGILTGSDGYGTFNPSSTIRRCEVATIVNRMAIQNNRKNVEFEVKQLSNDYLKGWWKSTSQNTAYEIYVYYDNGEYKEFHRSVSRPTDPYGYHMEVGTYTIQDEYLAVNYTAYSSNETYGPKKLVNAESARYIYDIKPDSFMYWAWQQTMQRIEGGCPFQSDIETYYLTSSLSTGIANNNPSESSATTNGTSAGSNPDSDNTYLAEQEFRRIKKDYPAAQGKYAYIYEYTDSQGNSCVLIRITYKLITDWEDMVLFAGGKRIPDPINYYKNLAARGYGNSRFMYMELERDVMVQIAKGNATVVDLRDVD